MSTDINKIFCTKLFNLYIKYKQHQNKNIFVYNICKNEKSTKMKVNILKYFYQKTVISKI